MGESSDSRCKIKMKLHLLRDKLCMIVCWVLPDLLPRDLLMAVLPYTCAREQRYLAYKHTLHVLTVSNAADQRARSLWNMYL